MIRKCWGQQFQVDPLKPQNSLTQWRYIRGIHLWGHRASNSGPHLAHKAQAPTSGLTFTITACHLYLLSGMRLLKKKNGKTPRYRSNCPQMHALSRKLHLKPNASVNTYILAIHQDAGKPEIGCSAMVTYSSATRGDKVKVSSYDTEQLYREGHAEETGRETALYRTEWINTHIHTHIRWSWQLCWSGKVREMKCLSFSKHMLSVCLCGWWRFCVCVCLWTLNMYVHVCASVCPSHVQQASLLWASGACLT